ASKPDFAIRQRAHPNEPRGTARGPPSPAPPAPAEGASPIDAVVTGGTGFVGANVARALVAAGATVRVLARPGGDRRALAGVSVEIAEGDLLDPGSVRRAVAGAHTVYHVAADYRLWAREPATIYRANVEGTRAVLEAAGEAGVSRVVHTSSVGALGIPTDGRPGTEDTPVTLADMVGDYKRSKFLAEQVALDFARRGLPVVVVNPSAPLGPWDVKPTPTGQMIVDFMRGRMIATVDTGLNIVHVRDVARGHLLAAERGKPGARYILGHAEGNLPLRDIFRLLAAVTGGRPPRFQVPYAVAWLGAACSEGLARVTGRPPAVPLTAVRMARKRMYFSPARAVHELGLPQTDVREALADAVAWFRAHGYAA
ncbi:MAG TPA: hopanoid-associated sugar epimerase, partial [Methylomirabilota bacterium]|nr:hopanoid-associated sugar epimerase [Methylomirabilota bacterium]